VIATIFGLTAIGVWFLLRRPGGDRRALKPLTVVLGLLLLQGAVGGVQWALELPTEIVWVHVALATITWLAMLWTVATAGRLQPRDTAASEMAERITSESPEPALTQS
jgi:cytochrome c oxidase assembly protein subunit 15